MLRLEHVAAEWLSGLAQVVLWTRLGMGCNGMALHGLCASALVLGPAASLFQTFSGNVALLLLVCPRLALLKAAPELHALTGVPGGCVLPWLDPAAWPDPAARPALHLADGLCGPAAHQRNLHREDGLHAVAEGKAWAQLRWQPKHPHSGAQGSLRLAQP